MSLYDDDLAYVHDVGFDFYAEGAAPGVLNLLRTAGIGDGLVVDLGCGSGIWARKLTDAGYDVLGVDLSQGMLKIARRKAPRATFVAESFATFRVPRCRAVTALGEVFNYLADSRAGFGALRPVCRRIYQALEPGGRLIFDVAEPTRGQAIRKGFRTGPDWTCLFENEHDCKRQILTRHVITFRRHGKHFRRHEETHRLQLYRPADVTAMLRDIGFRVRPVRRYGEFRLPAGMVGFVARRP